MASRWGQVTPANSSKVNIFPGNLNFGPEGKKGIFQQLLPLEAEGREGQLHRGIETEYGTP